MLNDSISAYDIKILNKEVSNEDARELGPLKYIAKSLNVDMDTVVNYFLLLIVFVIDPLAICLVIAANFAFSRKTFKGNIIMSFIEWVNVFKTSVN